MDILFLGFVFGNEFLSFVSESSGYQLNSVYSNAGVQYKEDIMSTTAAPF